eukprot:10322140-Ditylum_brightwellii.AAC.1
MLDHLLDWYGKITPADLVSNADRYKEPTDVSQPIDVYFSCIDDCIQYALDGKTPFSAKTDIDHSNTCHAENRMFQRWTMHLES